MIFNNINSVIEIIRSINRMMFAQDIRAQINAKIDHKPTHMLIIRDIGIDRVIISIEKRQHMMKNNPCVETNQRRWSRRWIVDNTVEIVKSVEDEPE